MQFELLQKVNRIIQNNNFLKKIFIYNVLKFLTQQQNNYENSVLRLSYDYIKKTIHY